MIIPKGFFLEVQHPMLGNKAHFIVQYLPKREAKAAKIGPANHHVALMTNLYVHPDHRGHGIGKFLLGALTQWQRHTRTDVVFLVSPYLRNSPCLDIWSLKNFYTTHGFPEIKGTAYHGRILTKTTTTENMVGVKHSNYVSGAQP